VTRPTDASVDSDFDVPLTPASAGLAARVADDTRIRAALGTIDELRRRGARRVLVSHLNRPAGSDPALSMRPVADRLGNVTSAPVRLARSVIGPQVRELTERLEPGQMLMLENVRFEPGEMRNDPALALALTELADLYVDDAFASAHRAHASTCGVAHHLPSAAGRLMEREVHALSAIVERPERPLVATLGAKTGDKIGVVRRFLGLADVACIGGALCFPFLAAHGHTVGYSLCPREDVEPARTALAATAGTTHRLALPKDLVLARWGRYERAVTRSLDGVDVRDGWMGLDIGTKTADWYAACVAGAATVLWTGPMGRFELPQFAAGTHAIADAVASTSATTVVGGGKTVEVVADDRAGGGGRPQQPDIQVMGGARVQRGGDHHRLARKRHAEALDHHEREHRVAELAQQMIESVGSEERGQRHWAAEVHERQHPSVQGGRPASP
jgi:phosphoglycerate kinase